MSNLLFIFSQAQVDTRFQQRESMDKVNEYGWRKKVLKQLLSAICTTEGFPLLQNVIYLSVRAQFLKKTYQRIRYYSYKVRSP